MDRLTLNDKGRVFNCKYAAPSITTGNFVADIENTTEEEVRTLFENPGRMTVENPLWATKEYNGYSGILDVRPDGENWTVVIKAP